MTPLPAPKALDEYFLEARCQLLNLAAILDRIDRGAVDSELTDTRRAKIREALTILLQTTPPRAEQIQQLFSLRYDAQWKRPEPR